MDLRKQTCRRMVIMGSIGIIFPPAAGVPLAPGCSSQTPCAGYGIGAMGAVDLYILFKLPGRVWKEESRKPGNSFPE